ncbi:MAG: 2-hydroxyacyl-CoA dehydratase [Oscillospiraceae bacterium]|jgi:predicted nucleotide-binding protein (sugar kinase/HSP70/actin superfamily)|nr:2-hydroxyacyl-CoA dehydratase [Oscillospiraceae bacterium]
MSKKKESGGRVIFTKEMKRGYTILFPNMLPVTFTLISEVFNQYGYRTKMLTETDSVVVENGLKYVHNDTCYPALLVIGQLLSAVKSGQYDDTKLALMITQTGGGCRASNYIHLLRKALQKSGYGHIPVISLNISGLEKNPGFKLGLGMVRKLLASMIYGDFIVWLRNQTKPYEVQAGDSDALTEKWTHQLIERFRHRRGLGKRQMRGVLREIARDFAAIALVENRNKPLVGIVGEIYVKFAPLGNNNLEDFLLSEGCEPVVPGLTDFMIFKINNRVVDVDLYGGSWIKKVACTVMQRYIEGYQREMAAVLSEFPKFRKMGSFSDLQRLIKGYLGYGNKMGEGWLLTAEMLELIHSGAPNIVCTQPFGCLPNHIVGKGMIKRLKDDYPESNIVSIDFDPGATRINQENRIKLMIANAKR